MASLTCTFCGKELGAETSSCDGCGVPVPLGAPEPTLTTTGGTGTESAEVTTSLIEDTPVDSPLSSPRKQERCDHDALAPGAVICPRCGTPVGLHAPGARNSARRAVLSFPWGEIALGPGEELAIGREVGPLERHLEPFTTVGRRHATLRLTSSGALLVRDHSSTNGTFVDGQRCSPAADLEVPPGVELRFSQRLRVTVRFEQ